ncbi:MAG: transposase [Verrucomicrobiales bacterium]
MSRTSGAALLFRDEEKEAFRILMWRLARFSGVEIQTYCVMSNHFHLLVRIPRRESFLRQFESDEPGGEGELRLLEHLKLLYSKAYLARLVGEIRDLRSQGREREVQRTLDRYKERFCDLSLFVKELKERFSRWFNKRHARKGTLWMGRFRSVIVESGACLRAVAAYIDLNPVRAGLVERPEDYRWCGYAEALGGNRRMQRNLCRAIGWPMDQWSAGISRRQSGAAAYRCLLYRGGMEGVDQSAPGAKKLRAGISIESAREVIASGGALSLRELVACRVRWFTEGVALGSEKFVRRVQGTGASPALLRSLPVDVGDGEPPWFNLSRLTKRGIG